MHIHIWNVFNSRTWRHFLLFGRGNVTSCRVFFSLLVGGSMNAIGMRGRRRFETGAAPRLFRM
jgi:hypothetical protein